MNSAQLVAQAVIPPRWESEAWRLAMLFDDGSLVAFGGNYLPGSKLFGIDPQQRTCIRLTALEMAQAYNNVNQRWNIQRVWSLLEVQAQMS